MFIAITKQRKELGNVVIAYGENQLLVRSAAHQVIDGMAANQRSVANDSLKVVDKVTARRAYGFDIDDPEQWLEFAAAKKV